MQVALNRSIVNGITIVIARNNTSVGRYTNPIMGPCSDAILNTVELVFIPTSRPFCLIDRNRPGGAILWFGARLRLCKNCIGDFISQYVADNTATDSTNNRANSWKDHRPDFCAANGTSHRIQADSVYIPQRIPTHISIRVDASIKPNGVTLNVAPPRHPSAVTEGGFLRRGAGLRSEVEDGLPWRGGFFSRGPLCPSRTRAGWALPRWRAVAAKRKKPGARPGCGRRRQPSR